MRQREIKAGAPRTLRLEAVFRTRDGVRAATAAPHANRAPLTFVRELLHPDAHRFSRLKLRGCAAVSAVRLISPALSRRDARLLKCN